MADVLLVPDSVWWCGLCEQLGVTPHEAESPTTRHVGDPEGDTSSFGHLVRNKTWTESVARNGSRYYYCNPLDKYCYSVVIQESHRVHHRPRLLLLPISPSIIVQIIIEEAYILCTLSSHEC